MLQTTLGNYKIFAMIYGEMKVIYYIVIYVMKVHFYSWIFLAVVERVNNCIANPDRGRLFAIVLIAGRQYKITDHDLVQTSGFMVGAEVGDRLRLERVSLLLLVCRSTIAVIYV